MSQETYDIERIKLILRERGAVALVDSKGGIIAGELTQQTLRYPELLGTIQHTQFDNYSFEFFEAQQFGVMGCSGTFVQTMSFIAGYVVYGEFNNDNT